MSATVERGSVEEQSELRRWCFLSGLPISAHADDNTPILLQSHVRWLFDPLNLELNESWARQPTKYSAIDEATGVTLNGGSGVASAVCRKKKR